MRKFVFVLLIVALLFGFSMPVPVSAVTSPGSFPNTITRGSLFFGTSPNDISVHIYSKCHDSNPPNGPWFVEFIVEYDNEDVVSASVTTNITADSGATPVGNDSRTALAGSPNNATQTLVPIIGSASTYANISVDVTVNAATQSLPLASAGCGPSNVSLSTVTAGAVGQGWLIALPLILLGLFTAVFLRRRAQA